jgi:sulfatase maturation enzyme AslB (radical SAM superfamily)
MMKLAQLTLIVTDACNFDCSYCNQSRENSYMEPATVDKAISFFYPYFNEDVAIGFYGGEPLLRFDLIQHAVSRFQAANRRGKKKPVYNLTTNGSLVTPDMLDFFNTHEFMIMLSFDGTAQDTGRRSGSLDSTRRLARQMQGSQYPGIRFSTNSVFSPRTVQYLSASLQDIIQTGITDINFALAKDQPWNETDLFTLEKQMEELSGFLLDYYQRTGGIPVTNFRGEEKSANGGSRFYCSAGRKRMSVSPEEDVWGCPVFHDYCKTRPERPDINDYRLGKLDDFITHFETLYPRIIKNYAVLNQACFFTADRSCFLCEGVDGCAECPVNAAYVTSFIGKIPTWNCRIKTITETQKRKLREKVKLSNRNSNITS